ncbi:hypothetical protein [Oceanivirga salmonicida]|uniref:hypothetical protein n=1 Tax=Oceanivirga salmonicida TaxID=1769291 RepID=UPI0012E1EB4A|nr:hypothetical protein [Oceanivirga salmonicida]
MRKKIILYFFLLATSLYSRELNFKRIADFKVETKHKMTINDKPIKFENEITLSTNYKIKDSGFTVGGKLKFKDNFFSKNPKIKEINPYIKYDFKKINNINMYVKSSLSYDDFSLKRENVNYKLFGEYDIKYKKNNLSFDFNAQITAKNLKKFRGKLENKIYGKVNKVEFIKVNTSLNHGYTKKSAFLIDNELQAGFRPSKKSRLVFNNRLRYIPTGGDNEKFKSVGVHILSGDLNKNGEISNNFNISYNYLKDSLNIKYITILEYMRKQKKINEYNNKIAYGQKLSLNYTGLPKTKITTSLLIAGITETKSKKTTGKTALTIDLQYTDKINKQFTIIPKLKTDFILSGISLKGLKTLQPVIKVTPEIKFLYRVHPLFRINFGLKTPIEFNNKKKKEVFEFNNAKPEMNFGIEYILR